jgi:hypothetical protein
MTGLVNTRDEQIRAIISNTRGLRADRLADCKSTILQAYEAESVIDQLASIVELDEREPSDFRVLTNSEARHIDHFNDDSYYWDMYCKELGRSIATGERAHIFEKLNELPGEGEPINAASPDLSRVSAAIQELRTRARPSAIIIPIALHGEVFHQLAVDMQTGRDLILPGGSGLHIFWGNRVVPSDRLVILDPECAIWSVKLDRETKSRLTIAIGRPASPAQAVTFLAETVAKYEIVDRSRIYVIEVEGIPEPET